MCSVGEQTCPAASPRVGHRRGKDCLGIAPVGGWALLWTPTQMQSVTVETAILGSEGQQKRHHLSYVQQWQQTQAAPLPVDPSYPSSCKSQSKSSLVGLTVLSTEQRVREPPQVALCSCLLSCCCISSTKVSLGLLLPSLSSDSPPWLPFFCPRLLFIHPWPCGVLKMGAEPKAALL